MAFAFRDVAEAESGSAGVQATMTLPGDVEAGDVKFAHITWNNNAVVMGALNNWTQLEFVNGPTYSSGVFWSIHDTPGAINWTGSSEWSSTIVAYSGQSFDATIVADDTAQSIGGTATIPRFRNLPEDCAVVAMSGHVNVHGATVASLEPGVYYMNQRNENIATAPRPAQYVADFVTDGAAETAQTTVYAHPPPTHSVGHAVAVRVSNVGISVSAAEGADTETVALTITLTGDFADDDEPVLVDWGDTNSETVDVDAGSGAPTHAYAVFAGPYTITATTASGASDTDTFDPVEVP